MRRRYQTCSHGGAYVRIARPSLVEGDAKRGVPAGAGTPRTQISRETTRARHRQRNVIRKPTIIVPRPTAIFHAPSFGIGYVPCEM